MCLCVTKGMVGAGYREGSVTYGLLGKDYRDRFVSVVDKELNYLWLDTPHRH